MAICRRWRRGRLNLPKIAETIFETFTGKEDADMADKKCGYAGKIQNSGAQKVNAPFANTGKKGTSTVKTGSDLRTGNKGGK